ncbi:MAG TPA: response regulator [Thermoanaerobaculia bacterium]|nr:response regulator [Thermoanaerobaculia bacterium]
MSQKILIADDDRVFVELLATRLHREGFEVSVVFDSVQAMMTAMRLRPDVLLLDVKMPGGTGLDALRKLKRSWLTAAIPVIVASTLDNPELPATVQALGAAEFLHKPVPYEVVKGSLTRALGSGGRAPV